MSTDLTLFDQPKAAVPDHLKNFLDEESNIDPRQSVPSLSYEGKIWTISANGEKTKLIKLDEDGDEVPLPVMRVFILDYSKRRGRAYYPGTYDPEKSSAPECWSDDGEKPDPSISEPKASKCADCPMAVKGSRTTDSGKSVTACSQHRMLVVVPAKRPDSQPLRMKIAVTSDYDKQSPELEQKGWFAFTQYRDWLVSKDIKHTAGVVTKMRFDANVAYPKVMFSPDRWTEDAELKTIKDVLAGDEVARLLKGTWNVNGVDGDHRDPDDDVKSDDDTSEAEALAAKEAAAEKKAAEKAAAEKKAKAEAAAKKKAEKEAAEKAAAAEKKAAALADDDDDDGSSADAGTASSDIPDDVTDLLAEWGE